jgi:hypothetical protein
MKLLSLACAAALTPVSFVLGDSPTDPPEGKFQDTWLAIMLGEQKIGYGHFEMTREKDKVRSSQFMKFEMKRAGQGIVVSMKEEGLESLDGKPLGFQTEMTMAEFPTRVRGTIRDGHIKVVTEQFGSEVTQDVVYPSNALMAWAALLEQRKYDVVPGQKIQFNVYSPSQALNVGIRTAIEVHGRETVQLHGAAVDAFRTTAIATLPNGTSITTKGWVDSEWDIVKQQVSMMGFELTMIRCDERFAVADSDPVEMFIDTLIPIGRPIDRRAKAIRYRIKSKDGGEVPDIPETAMQRIISRSPGEIVLEVRRIDHIALRAATHRPVPPELGSFLKTGSLITSKDPQVVALAKKAAGESTDPYERVGRLRQTVSDTVRYEGLGTGFASAAEVCRRKVGDCTENGVLLAAMGRAAGIPSRVVTGLIYVHRVADREHVLGFHMWTQCWINGMWVDLDAAWKQTDADPTHIALGTHAVVDSTLLSGMMLRMNELKITIVDVE